MRIFNALYMALLCIALLTQQAFAQGLPANPAEKQGPLDFNSFLQAVLQHNIAYAAEKFNVNIAEAEVMAARVFPDPEISMGWFDNGERRLNMGYGFSSELTWTLALGGKRKARIDLAKNQASLVQLLLADYLRNMRADATLSFLQAMQNQRLLEVLRQSHQNMLEIANADSIRFKLGAISEVDARQSKLEAASLYNEIIQAEADWRTSLTDLSVWLGQNPDSYILPATQELTGFVRQWPLAELIVEAQNNRVDLKAALQQKSIAESTLRLAKANRALDLGLSVAVEQNAYARNIIAPTPAFTKVSAGLSVPLKFSNRNKGELLAVNYEIVQNEKQYLQLELEVSAQVTQAHQRYLAAQKQLQHFDHGMLQNAKAILDGKIYSYNRGESSLLEVLNAQRTYNELQLTYYQTRYLQAMTLVELERAAGIWDINF
ncbi:TolC family protein [Sphingobacterium sp. Mn56C]|uniref:TolC family protein n=1 Tax=Sphingobacterium sp. Mn56C TaxID=3395261 RepID=UPI003BD0458C